MDNGRKTVIHRQFEELDQTYSGLVLCEDAPGRWAIRGMLSFSATFQDVTITDAFSILIMLPQDYPDSPPTVQETGGRIPENFHQYSDRTFCLGAPVEVWRRFKADPRLVAFVRTLVVEYLYGYAHLEKHGTLPFGELSHGCQGIREYYQELFNTDDVQIALALLKVLADGTYRGHQACPCGAGKILRKCHGPILLGLLEHQPKTRFLRDATNVLYSLEKSEMEHFNWNLLPKTLKRELDEMARESQTGEMRMTRHNENKPGYKKTKVGWIPEEWKCVPFTRLFDRASAPVIVELEGTYREIGIRSHCKGVFLKEEVIGKTLGNKRVFWCQPGTLVFNIVFAWEQAVAVLSPETEGLIASHRFPMYGAKNGCASEMFYLLFFSSPRGKHGLTLASPGGAGRNKTLGQGELDFLFLPAPPLPEQERIVVVLSAWDRAIALTDRLIDAKQRMKKGLMQQLLTGLRRFPEFEPRNTRTRKTKDTLHEGWSLLPLKQVCKLLYGKDWKSIALQTGGYPVYGSGGEIGRSSKAIDDGPAVLLGRKGTIDCPLYLQGPFWAVDTTYYAKVSEHADASFLFYLFSAIKWRRYNEASGVPSLSRNTIECLKVLLPTLVEQRKIASCLSACDREIQLLTRKRDCLKEQRKGLMQKLLTGEVKIKLQEMKNG